ncbi:4-hydroxy-tetrahydrodipicolinate reductase [Paenibacillus marchantiophytorum]|uniref:4-hydroxy-tetrahydrodipicolinate reductase n=1 Tax=Paenibacillus marchantiophytorum TaxID=1619310 RepID=A0ABQ1EX72_9BACL|nr:4-hydroxy-tetrahydrodipicolinate reductase [Paenibacillus marchantiophytorum]GFZ89939.1 4-hydroxy-tetrahydrodipicolinate reductase [Paenibacillus marchantiophytorum]
MDRKIRVAVIGASGRMGREVVKTVLTESDMELVAGVSRSSGPIDLGKMVGLEACDVYMSNNVEQALIESKPDVLVDFTGPQTAVSHTNLAIRLGIRPVMGTTGFTPEAIVQLDKQCQEGGIGGIIAPNFSIGAILMMKFAAQASKYFPNLEIIEYHGDQKLDAPSGTAVKTAELISEVREERRQGNPKEEETIEGSRGGYYNGFRIHSVRLPGIFAQQEVIMAEPGQALKIRHDSYDRAAYMPGVAIAVRKVMTYSGMIYGFEHFID